MKKALITIVLAGLAHLSVAPAPARAAVVLDGPAVASRLSFRTIVQAVSGEEPPEWARVPNAQAWFEIRLGAQQGGLQGMIWVIRGLLLVNADDSFLPGMRLPARQSGEGMWVVWSQQTTDSPEPSGLALLAAGLLFLGFIRRRR